MLSVKPLIDADLGLKVLYSIKHYTKCQNSYIFRQFSYLIVEKKQ